MCMLCWVLVELIRWWPKLQIITIMRLRVGRGSGYVDADVINSLTNTYAVEEIPNFDANPAICHWLVCCILRKYVFSSPYCSHQANILIAYQHYADTYYKGILPSIGNCAGSEPAALFGCGLLTSYLGLFINFYLQTYKTPAKNSGRVANGKANGNLSVL